jgi:hypothetical protein
MTEVFTLAAQGQRHPDIEIAAAADQWADQVLAGGIWRRWIAGWTGAVAWVLVTLDATDESPGWEHRMAKRIKRLPTDQGAH